MWWSLLLACDAGVRCESPEQVIAGSAGLPLRCSAAQVPVWWLERVAGRGLSAGDQRLMNRYVAEAWEADPAGTSAWLDELRVQGRHLEGLWGLAGAERRSELVFKLQEGSGLVSRERGEAWNLAQRSLSVWASDPEEGLAMTESDIEGWIHYVSLCREVQGGGPLRLSVADRVTLYRAVQERFTAAPHDAQVGLVAFGPFWESVKAAWQAGSYEKQQAWIRAAPLPPPMEVDSLTYARALLASDPAAHAAALHDHWGPLGWEGERRFLVEAP